MYKTKFLILVIFIILFVPIANSSYDIGDPFVIHHYNAKRFHYNVAVRLQNGDILIAHHNDTDNPPYSTDLVRSTDGGETWTVTPNFSPDNCTTSLGVAPNGTVVMFDYRQEDFTGNLTAMRYRFSYDNGYNWTSCSYINSTNPWQCVETQTHIKTRNGVMYVPIYSNTTHFLYVSTDNGSTWHQRGENIHTKGGADVYNSIAFLPNGTIIWMCEDMEGYRDVFAFSEDDGYTWSDSKYITPSASALGLRWIGDYCFLIGRERPDTKKFNLWNTTDGFSWVDIPTQLDWSDGNVGEQFYNSNVIVDDDLLITYSYGFANDRDEIRGIWITNISGTEDEGIQFVSIEGQANGSTIYTGTPTFNWTKQTNVSQYWLQVTTDSDFSTVVINITNINEYNYPTKYSENDTVVSFTLPNDEKLPTYNTYYCRVKAYIKEE